MRLRMAGFMVTFILVILSAPLPADAQQPGKVRRIGYVAIEPSQRYEEPFRQELRERGWIEGQNLAIEYRYAQPGTARMIERLREPMAELVRLKVDVIVTQAPGAWPARDLTKTIPVVFSALSDPVGLGFVASLARPGGNMTGLSYLGIELNPKRLELLKEAVPKVTRIGVLASPVHPAFQRMVKDLEVAAQALKVQLHVFEAAREPKELDSAFEGMARERVGAVILLQSAMFYEQQRRIADLALKHRLPAIYDFSEFPEAGGFMSFTASPLDLVRRAATYVDISKRVGLVKSYPFRDLLSRG